MSETFFSAPPLNLQRFENFCAHPWVMNVIRSYGERESIRAHYAKTQIEGDLRVLQADSIDKLGTAVIGDVKGKVKGADSLLRKIYRVCQEKAGTVGITQETIDEIYRSVKDICGVRVSCPYYDQVEPAVKDHIRPELARKGYRTNITEPGFEDANYLDRGDEYGYRSYHFYVYVPTQMDIYGRKELVLCEMQVRSQLQHIWAEKSHDLLYKPDQRWQHSDSHVRDDMKEISNLFHAADKLLVSIRDRTHGDQTDE